MGEKKRSKFMFVTFFGLLIVAAGVAVSNILKEDKQKRKYEDYYL